MAGYLYIKNGTVAKFTAINKSTGTDDKDKIVSTNADGKIDLTLIPEGIGDSANTFPATETMSAGAFVNLFDDTGTAKIRLADNSNGRPAHGFIKTAASTGETVTVYHLGATNTYLAVEIGARYYLGTTGSVVKLPVDPDSAASGTIHQFLGIAKSTTELVTTPADYILL